MKKFILEILIFTIILFLVLKLIKLTVPYYWGNDLITHKMEYLDDSNVSYDTYFIGSSKMYRHINPIIFEKITGKSSFNLGAAGTYALETEYLIDNLISSHKLSPPKNIYVQKISYENIGERNLHSIRANYYLDTKRVIRGVKHFFRFKKYEQIYFHIISYIENQLCIGQLIDICKFNFCKKPLFDKTINKQNGFYSLNQELLNSNVNHLRQRRNKFLRKIRETKQKKMRTKKLGIRKLSLEKFNIKKNFHITLRQIYGNPISNPINFFDKAHYNSNGANRFTTQIGRLVNSKKKI